MYVGTGGLDMLNIYDYDFEKKKQEILVKSYTYIIKIYVSAPL